MIGAQHRWQAALGTLLLLALGLVAATMESIQSMVRVWLAATTYHHCFLVLPISLYLAWQRRKALQAMLPEQEPLALAGIFAFGLLWLIGRAGGILLFEHVAVVGMLISLVIALLGRRIAKEIAFPLAFLFFMVPFGDFLVPHLQQFTANFAVALIRLAGIPVFHDGIIIEIPGGVFEVAEACAGIRFLIANVMVGALFAHIAFERRWKWALFLLLSVVIPVVANGLRAFGIIMIAYWTDHEYAAGVDHLVYGWGFFAAIMLVFLTIGSRMADWPALADGDDLAVRPAGGPWRVAFLVPLLLVLASAPLYASIVLDRAIEAPPPQAEGEELLVDLAPLCEPLDPASGSWRPRFAGADFAAVRRYRCDGEPVELFIAYYLQVREGAELVQHSTRLDDGEAWTRIASGWHAPAIVGLPETIQKEQHFGRQGGNRMVLGWYWIGGRTTAKDWQAKLFQLWNTLTGRKQPAAVVALSTPDGGAPAAALTRLERVLARHERIDAYLAAVAAGR
jgi:exosortase A